MLKKYPAKSLLLKALDDNVLMPIRQQRVMFADACCKADPFLLSLTKISGNANLKSLAPPTHLAHSYGSGAPFLSALD
jgi:hypothetical protein